MSKFRDEMNEWRERRRMVRQFLIPCSKCGRKNPPEFKHCVTCREPNENFKKAIIVKEIKNE